MSGVWKWFKNMCFFMWVFVIEIEIIYSLNEAKKKWLSS